MSLTIGLTGGIASGKSLAQREFEALGVPVLDADQVSRAVVMPGSPGLAAIAAHFGAGFLQSDGQLDRRRLREHVFARPEARRELEAITHPLIRTQMRDWLAQQTAPYAMLSVAILIEGGMQSLVQRVLVVDAPEELQRARLQARDSIGAELAAQMLAAQATRAQRLAAADDVLVNDSSPEALCAAVRELHGYYLDLAARNTPRAPGLRLPQPAESVRISGPH